MAEMVCAKCDGTGWVLGELEGISGVTRCDCVLVERKDRIERTSNIPPLYHSASFENFLLPKEKDNPVANRNLGSVMMRAKSYAREYPLSDKPGLLFIGEPGTGKTHLAVAALRSLIERGFEGLFFDYQNLLDRIRTSYDPASGTSDKEAYRSALDAEILLLDDLGAHRTTDWVEDTVTSIITHRCNNRKALIATTNLPDPDAAIASGDRGNTSPGGRDLRRTLAEGIGMRARSRLFEMCHVIRVSGVEDFRIKKARLF